MNRKIRTIKPLVHFLKATVGTFLVKRYNVFPVNRELLQSLRPPYLVLSNHCCVLDPFLIYKFLPGTPQFVATDAAFRSPIKGFLLSIFGTIPITKVLRDTEPVKHILDARKKGRIIGIFPEGQSSHDGHSLPLIYSTSKLIKLLKIPIVIVHMNGSYFSDPRWAKQKRRGKIFVHFKEIIEEEVIKRLSVEDLHSLLTEKLSHDEYAYQQENMIPFVGNALAENLEEAIYVCPQCKTIGSMFSKNNQFSCNSCNYGVSYNTYGFFEPYIGELVFRSVRDWNIWQREHYLSLLKEYVRDRDTCILTDKNAIIRRGYRSEALKDFHSGSLSLFSDRIELTSDGRQNNKIEYEIKEIDGITVQDQEKMEFYYKGVLYSISFADRKTSTYKWVEAVNFFQDNI